MSELATLAEEHVRAALLLAEANFPAFDVDSWSEPAVPGQWVLIGDDEGRRGQVKLDTLITRGVKLERGEMSRRCAKLAVAVVSELRTYAELSRPIVSRPLPDPERDDVHAAHLEFRGVWMRLVVHGDTAVLSALLGRGPQPLAEPEEMVTWLN